MQDLQLSVIGAGQMGAGFVVHFRSADLPVTLIDHRQSNLDDARSRIRETVRFLNDRGMMEASPEVVLDGVTFTLDAPEGVAESEIVLETVAEDLETKREVFETVAAAAPSNAILATNTSGIPITEIAAGFPFADRVVGCHWLFPPYLLPTVEVIRGESTSEETVDRLAAFVEAVGRKPIIVHRDVPGFVWNRVQFAVLRECAHIVEEGVASVEDVNTAIRDGYARRTAVIGPFETVDIAGLELFKTVGDDLIPELSNAETVSDLFDDYLAEGRGGVEKGAGFFSYNESPEDVQRQRDDRLIEVARALEEDG
ncbi:3-hydroxyacyl-CoA dehydrogenase family protein [Saliphagus infecundisoli]|uniref:3-hydroxyacyl-CoA dehydrogenase family protein n=1 Tax=Saliphagus infecundisoli TaxID=1849069 RepID=A0ABD5QBM0_9EURY|nr:3-hydroxyacyl-CoA dehydrogenase NAD-binding domain-containing protein [Saliphagus infecundisoli]